MKSRLLMFLILILLLVSSSTSVLAGDGASKAEQYAQLAETAYWAGDLDTSITNYAQAHTLAPDNEDHLFEYVRNLVYGSYAGREYRFRAETALTVAQSFAVEHPDNAKGQAAYALALVENGEDAIVTANRAVELAPELAEAYAYLSIANRAENQWQSSQENAQTAVNLNDKSVDAHRALALSLAFTGEWALAIDEYRLAIGLHPMLDTLYFELGPYYVIQEDFESAHTVYNTVIEYNPENAKAWTRKCETFFRQRDDKQALEACGEALKLAPKSPDVLKLTGVVNYTVRDYETALEYFEQCVTAMNEQSIPLNEQLEECYYFQGLAYYYLEQCHKAEPIFAFVLDNLELTERGRENTLAGLDLCMQSSS